MSDIAQMIASGHGIEETSTRMEFSPSFALQMVREGERAGGMERVRETQSWKGAESAGSSIRRDGRREEVFTLNRGPLQSSLPTTQSLSLFSPFSIMNSSLLFTLLIGVAIVVSQQYDDEEIGLVVFFIFKIIQRSKIGVGLGEVLLL